MPKTERRAFDRKRLSLRLEAKHDLISDHTPITARMSMDVVDLSLGGLSATIDQPMIRGSHLAVFFPPQHHCHAVLAGGKIVRCERNGPRYRIGLEFDRFPTARGRLPYTAPELARYCMPRPGVA